MEEVIIEEENIETEDSYKLLNELSEQLRVITGNSGRASFNNDDMRNNRAVFAIARDKNGNALGCGALRYYSENVAEIKRMYVRKKGFGVGTKMLSFLEDKAKTLGYKKIILETRKVNKNAVSFYNKNKYIKINNYGRYVGREEAICFEKYL